MNQFAEFFVKLFDSSDWPPRWHCGQWTAFNGWLYIASDLLIWSAYFTIPIVILRYIFKKQNVLFLRLYFLFAAFILACGATHFLDAIAFWLPLYRLSALVRFTTGIVSWLTVFYLVKYLPDIFSLKSHNALKAEIQQRKDAEEQLKKSQKDFQLLVGSIKDYAIFMVDTQGNIFTWNSGAQLIYGYSAEQIIGRNMEVFYTPEEIENSEPQQNLIRALKDGHFETEGLRVRDDGSVFYASVVFTALYDEAGKLYGYAKITKNISEKRKTDEHLRFLATIAENIQDPVISSDNDLCITSWNNAAEELFEWRSDEVIGKDSGKILKSLYQSATREQTIIDYKRKGYWQGETIYHTRSGKEVYALATASYLKNSDEKITGNLIVIKDITKRKNAEEALSKLNEELEQRVEERTEAIRKSEIHFRSLIENSAEGILLLDAYATVIYRSPSGSKILGNNPKEDVISLAHQDSVGNFESKFAEALSKPGIPVPYRVKYLHYDGHYFWAEGTFTNLLHIEAVHAIVANFRDVTSRKIAEENLVESEKQYRYLFENNPMPMVVMDLKTFKFLDVNETTLAHYGYSREEMLCMTALDIRPQEDRELFKKLDFSFNLYATNYNKGIWRHRKKDGTIIYVEVIAHEILYEGIAARLLLVNDITERKKSEEELIKSEEHYRMLIDQSPDGIFIANEKGYYIDVNKAGCKMMGYTHQEIKNLTLTDLLVEEELSRLPDEIARYENGAVITSEWKFKRKDSSVFIGELVGRSLPDGRLQGIVRDIAHRIETAKKIQKLNIELEGKVIKRTEQLRKTNEELEAFSYSVSHDLRAPLRSIIGFTNILEEEYGKKLDTEAMRITGIIKNSTVKMGCLIDDLLAFSRLGRQDLLKEWTNMNSMVDEIIKETDVQNIKKPIVKWHIHKLPDSYADKNTIRQVWVNLISNAVKYSSKTAHPEIEIGTHKDKDKITFYIKDNGVGFDEKYKEKLFKVFQRLTSDKDFEGTGIGLAIVDKIIARHGGEVWADAKLGEGATFYFSLPLYE